MTLLEAADFNYRDFSSSVCEIVYTMLPLELVIYMLAGKSQVFGKLAEKLF
jgi:hypothetical protein